MAAMVTVLYPDEAGSSFDWDYFLNRHVPMVATALCSGSLTGIKVALGLSGAVPGDSPAYQAVMIISFEDIVVFHRPWRQHHHRIIADVQNFTNTRPQLQLSENIAFPRAEIDVETIKVDHTY